jgi:hypothetical protein
MELFLLLASLFIVAVAVYWFRRKPVGYHPAETRPRSNPYHAVAVKYPKDACAAVRQVEAKRFLTNEAPPLPLPNCTVKNCGCRFIHFNDRRDEDRRERVNIGHYDGVQRRSRQDRRRA